LQQRVEYVVEKEFDDVVLISLTFNRENFAGPREAYEAGAARITKFVERLWRWGLITTREWFRVLECHESGWPHFHVLLNAKRIPFEDVFRAWNGHDRVKGEKPRWGIVDIRGRKAGWEKRDAVGYVCAYVTKRPADGWPAWIMESEGRIRRFQASKGFWGGLREDEPGAIDFSPGELEGAKKSAKPREIEPIPQRMRVAACGGKTVIRRVCETEVSGGEIELRSRFVACVFDAVEWVANLIGYVVEEGRRSVRIPVQAIGEEGGRSFGWAG
jgi:hypothetical protein